MTLSKASEIGKIIVNKCLDRGIEINTQKLHKLLENINISANQEENILFALDNNEPKLPVGLHITSAATPDFQANPRPVIQELRKAGSTYGILIFFIISLLFIP